MHAKSKINEASVTSDKSITEMGTFPSDLEIVASFNHIHLYAYPVSPEASLAIGYDVFESLEVGAALGFNTYNEDHPELKTSDTEYALYTVYTQGLNACDLEVGLAIVFGKGVSETKDNNGSVTSETKTNQLSYEIAINSVFPIEGGLSYVGGIGYAIENYQEKKSDTKIQTSVFALNLATFRYTF